ncbi:MAG: ComEA family DNA-binding protein [Dysgonomonas sp.]
MKKLIKWKDYFYFRKSDKVSIILLLILITLSAIVYVGSGIWKDYASVEDDTSALAEFDEFQRNLKPIYNTKISDGSDSSTDTTEHKGKKVKADKSKLQEGQTIDLNAADVNTLKRIPGIGDTFAERIVEYRKMLGGFAKVEQLTEVQGISKKKFDNIALFFFIRKKNTKLKVNKLTASQLSKHPYISDKQSEAIVQKRAMGRISSIEELSKLADFRAADIQRLKEYISFD